MISVVLALFVVEVKQVEVAALRRDGDGLRRRAESRAPAAGFEDARPAVVRNAPAAKARRSGYRRGSHSMKNCSGRCTMPRWRTTGKARFPPSRICRSSPNQSVRLSRSFALPTTRLLGFDDGAARVVTAVRANDVRGLRRAALGAGLQLLGPQRIVRTAHAGAGIRMFTLRYGHLSPPPIHAIYGNRQLEIENPPSYAAPPAPVNPAARREFRGEAKLRSAHRPPAHRPAIHSPAAASGYASAGRSRMTRRT